MKPRQNEFRSCVALLKWWQYFCRTKKLPESLLYHIPNASVGGARRGAMLKAMGVRKGIPDYCLAIARGGFHGLYLEMKTVDGRISPEQKILGHQLREQGYDVRFSFSTSDAMRIIEDYLK